MNTSKKKRERSGHVPSPVHRTPGDRGYVYFSAPRLVFRTQLYRRALDAVRTHWPHTQIVESRHAFVDVDDWRRRWPLVLSSIRVLVFVTDSAGYIGRGVWHEINEAESAGVPVLLVNAFTGGLHGLADCDFSTADPEDWNRHVRVTLRLPTER